MRKGYNENSINQINKEVILNHVVKNTTLRKKCILTDCIILFYCRSFIDRIKHFEEKCYKKGKNSKRYLLAMYMKPVLTVFQSKKLSRKIQKQTMLPHQSVFLRDHRGNVYQEDQCDSFISKDSVKDYTCLNESFSPMSNFTS